VKSKLSEDFPCTTETENQQTERKVMNDKFDELAKGLAQSVTRRGALKRFGVGLAGAVLASLGLMNNAMASKNCPPSYGHCKAECKKSYAFGSQDFDICMNFCLDPGQCI
jgi:hypothetical protein